MFLLSNLAGKKPNVVSSVAQLDFVHAFMNALSEHGVYRKDTLCLKGLFKGPFQPKPVTRAGQKCPRLVNCW